MAARPHRGDEAVLLPDARELEQRSETRQRPHRVRRGVAAQAQIESKVGKRFRIRQVHALKSGGQSGAQMETGRNV